MTDRATTQPSPAVTRRYGAQDQEPSSLPVPLKQPQSSDRQHHDTDADQERSTNPKEQKTTGRTERVDCLLPQVATQQVQQVAGGSFRFHVQITLQRVSTVLLPCRS